jgi:hypothetical protein
VSRDRDARALVRGRLAAQGLLLRGDGSPEEVVGRLLAVQAQDLRAARLAVRSRSRGLRATDVDDALTRRRTLVVAWLCRGTLHLVRAEDLRWLHALVTPRLKAGSDRRLRQEGVSPAQAAAGVAVVSQALRVRPRTRAELAGLLAEAGVPTAGQALVHVLLAAALAGHAVRGPVLGGEQAWVDPGTWLGPEEPVGREEALARLARRYLVGHGPAAPEDLAVWAGITLGDARRGFAALGDAAVPGPAGTRVLADAPAARRMPGPRLLGGFDPVLHGWRSREALVDGHGSAVTSHGVFRATALVGGRTVATWSLTGGRIAITPFARVTPAARTALDREAADVLRFLGLPDRAPGWRPARTA